LPILLISDQRLRMHGALHIESNIVILARGGQIDEICQLTIRTEILACEIRKTGTAPAGNRAPAFYAAEPRDHFYFWQCLNVLQGEIDVAAAFVVADLDAPIVFVDIII